MVQTKLASGKKAQDDIEALKALIRDVPDFPKPGILFRDITPLLGNPDLFQKTIELLARPYAKTPPDYIAGIEARGFILAAPVAHLLGCGLVPIRKPKKLPAKTLSITYELEYGEDSLEIHADAFNPHPALSQGERGKKDGFYRGKKVVIVDDLLATGGTALAATQLVEKAGGKIMGISFLIELAALKGRIKLKQHPIQSLINY